MKAIICTKYGPPEHLKLVEIEKPKPKKNEVLIKIHSTTVHIGDTKIRRLAPGMGPVIDFFFVPAMRIGMGFTKPRKQILGMELAGKIEAIGEDVTKFEIGDKVFAATEMNFGAYAEYTTVKENDSLLKMPSNMNYKEAAPVSNAGVTALYPLRKAKIQKGQNVLIYGASGSVGVYAVQIAKYYGANVTGVCSTVNLEMVESIGADKVIDYTKEDFTKYDIVYDVIYDAVGKIPKKKRKVSLKKDGIFINVLALGGGLKVKVSDLEELKELIENGHLTTIIDREYHLENMVEAHRYVDKGHKKGNVIININ
jgi:NADPH:quinone reductase-like Zn-dependent oxidoreductase